MREKRTDTNKNGVKFVHLLAFAAGILPVYEYNTPFLPALSHYWIPAILGTVVLYILFTRLIESQFHHTLSLFEKLLILLLLATLFTMTLPRILHLHSTSTQYLCIKADLIEKHRYGRYAKKTDITVNINTGGDLPLYLSGSHNLRDLPSRLYFTLPQAGSPLKLCGTLSGKGFYIQDVTMNR